MADLLTLLSWEQIHHTKVNVVCSDGFLLPSAYRIRVDANCGSLGSNGRDATVASFITGKHGDGFRMFGQNLRAPHLIVVRSISIERFDCYYTYNKYVRPAARWYTDPGYR